MCVGDGIVRGMSDQNDPVPPISIARPAAVADEWDPHLDSPGAWSRRMHLKAILAALTPEQRADAGLTATDYEQHQRARAETAERRANSAEGTISEMCKVLYGSPSDGPIGCAKWTVKVAQETQAKLEDARKERDELRACSISEAFADELSRANAGMGKTIDALRAELAQLSALKNAVGKWRAHIDEHGGGYPGGIALRDAIADAYDALTSPAATTGSRLAAGELLRPAEAVGDFITPAERAVIDAAKRWRQCDLPQHDCSNKCGRLDALADAVDAMTGHIQEDTNGSRADRCHAHHSESERCELGQHHGWHRHGKLKWKDDDK